jgi:hypothetical protein
MPNIYRYFILIDILKSLNSLIVTLESPETQFAEKPLAASDEEAKARIDERFENAISPLLNVKQAGFSQCGRY